MYFEVGIKEKKSFDGQFLLILASFLNKVSISSFDLDLDGLIELEFIVIDTRIDARSVESKLENPASN